MLGKWNKEQVFKIRNVKRADENEPQPACLERHYAVMLDAMKRDDRDTVANRQVRLLRGSFEVPLTVSQCAKLLEKTRNAS
jgi:hypothetical protein